MTGGEEIAEEIAAREAWRALLNTPNGCRATLRMLLGYWDRDDLIADIDSMTNQEALMAARFVRSGR